MSPLDRIANVSILKVLRGPGRVAAAGAARAAYPHPGVSLQEHEVDKLYKVESRPALSASDQ